MKRLVFFSALWLLMACLAPPANAEDRALLIGVGNYQDPQAQDLPGIDKDLENMREVAAYMGFRPGQVRVIANEQATCNSIRRNIKEWLINGVSRDDRVLFYFSGHGSQIPDRNGDETVDNADEILAPHDIGAENNTLVRAFVDDEFGDLLAQIRSENVLVFIDACHSGTATKGLWGANSRSVVLDQSAGDAGPSSKLLYYSGMPTAPTKGSFVVDAKTNSRDNYVSLSAAQDNEPAIPTREGSLFTLAILDAVKKAAADKKELTMSDLKNQTSRFIETIIARNQNPRWQVHHPQLVGNERLKGIDILRSGQVEPPPGNLWDKLVNLVKKRTYPVQISANKNSFNIGDTLVITCRVNRPGYLNVVNVDPTDKDAIVLFPNHYKSNNRVAADTSVTIPAPDDRFVLRTKPPRRKNLVAVFHTAEPVNAYENGYGGAKDLFKTYSILDLISVTTRSFRPEGRDDVRAYGAGMIEVEIK